MLREYQHKIVRDTSAAFSAGAKGVCIQSATGSGKTLTAADMAVKCAKAGLRVLWTVPRIEILNQTTQTLLDLDFPTYALVAGRRGPIPLECMIVVASSQTLMRRDLGAWVPDWIFADEMHCLYTQLKSYVARWPKARRIGLTATPCRLSGEPLKVWATHMVQGPAVKELISMGNLVPFTYLSFDLVDPSTIPKRRGEYDADKLSEVFEKPKILAGITEHWQKEAGTRLRTLVFAVSVRHAQFLSARFRERGVDSDYVTGESSKDERQEKLNKLRNATDPYVLVNVGLFVEGLDVPSIDCLILATATASLSRFLQMIGRCLRPSEGKKDALILDCSANWAKHDLPDTERYWSLEGRIKRNSDLGSQMCLICRAVFPKEDKICPRCGASVPEVDGPPNPKKVEMIHTNLREITAADLGPVSKDTPPRDPPAWMHPTLSGLWNWAEWKRYKEGKPLPFRHKYGYSESVVASRMRREGLPPQKPQVAEPQVAE